MSDRQAAAPNDLSGFIQNQPYQQFDPGTGAVISGGTNADGQGAQTQAPGSVPGEGASPAGGNVGQAPQAVQQQSGVTIQDPAEAERRAAFFQSQTEMLNQQLLQATQALQGVAQAENARKEREFEDSLRDLSPAEAEARRLQRQNQALANQNTFYQNQMMQIQQAKNATEQRLAKAQVAQHVAQEFGMPSDMSYALMGATDYENMRTIAADIANRVGNGQNVNQAINAAMGTQYQQVQQQPQQFQQNPAYVASGAGMGNAVETPQPVKGSGDLLTFIHSRPYQQVPVRE